MNRIERKYMAHYIDTTFTYDPRIEYYAEFNPSWYRIGEDLEEYNVELSPRVEVEQNFRGDDWVVSNGYEMSGEADPFYAYEGDALFSRLQSIIDNLYDDKKCFTYALEVQLFTPLGNGAYKAYMRPCYVTPIGYGGDTTGYQIPFGVAYLNNFNTQGRFVPDGNGSGTFTPDT